MKKFFGISLIGFLLFPAAAHSEVSRADMSYSVYFGGLRIIDLDVTTHLVGQSYGLTSLGKSAGFLDLIFPFQSSSNARGNLSGSALLEIHSTYDGDTRDVSVRHKAGDPDPVVSIIPPFDEDEREPVPPELRRGSVNPVAAAFGMGTESDPSKACHGVLPIYDGKTRADVSLKYIGPAELPASDYSAYSGATELCDIRFERLAGKRKKSWFSEFVGPPDIKIWIARPKGLSYWIPVRVEADHEHYSIILHLEKFNPA